MSPRLRVPPGVLRGGALGLGLLLAASGLTGWLDVLARLACGATFAWAKQLPLPLVLGASAADLPLAPLAWDAVWLSLGVALLAWGGVRSAGRVALAVVAAVALSGAGLAMRDADRRAQVACVDGSARYAPGSELSHPQNDNGDAAFVSHHNRWGLRGPEPDTRPAVLMVGDSFVYGSGLQDDETIAVRLGEALPGLQVINAGMESDNLAGALARAARWLPRVSPAALVLGVTWNDDNPIALDDACAVPLLCRHRLSFSLIDHRAALAASTDPAVRARVAPQIAEAWRALVASCAERSIPVVVFGFHPGTPFLGTLVAEAGHPVRLVESPCRPPQHFFAPDGRSHLNPEGARCAAGALAEALATLGVR